MNTSHVILILFVLLAAIGCTQSTSSTEEPQWVKDLIADFTSEPVGNPPQSIWRYEYKSQIVYYVPAQCCDQYSTLYDANGDVICVPNGGIDGYGDGMCPDFSQERKNEMLIWEDPRPR